jgi:hypothetical protein
VSFLSAHGQDNPHSKAGTKSPLLCYPTRASDRFLLIYYYRFAYGPSHCRVGGGGGQYFSALTAPAKADRRLSGLTSSTAFRVVCLFSAKRTGRGKTHPSLAAFSGVDADTIPLNMFPILSTDQLFKFVDCWAFNT